MIVERLKFILLLAVILCPSFSWAASQDIENRLIYADYSKNISMDFRDASLTDILKIFSKQSGMNFISADNISNKKITLFLDNIPIDEALEKILEANDLTYEMAVDSDVFIVKPKLKDENVTRVFPLKYATVSSSKINGAAGKGAGDIAGIIKNVLSATGKLQEDSRTNSLVVTDIPTQFPLIEETITKLDVPVVQVLIEVEMLDVSKSATEFIGISYGQTPLAVNGGTREVLYPWNQNQLLRKGYVDQPAYTTGILDASGMSAALDFLRTQTDTRSLARPRLMTLNNQPAHIEISTNESLSVQSIATSIGNNGAQSTAQVERQQTGVILDVTPQVNPVTGEILMVVSPQVKEARSGLLVVQGQPVKDVETRSTNSILKVKNGQTIIIGGLLRTVNSDARSKLPFLGNMPVIGAAFRHKDKTVSERELVVFITPHILNDKIKEKMDTETKVRFNREIELERKDAINQQLDSR